MKSVALALVVMLALGTVAEARSHNGPEYYTNVSGHRVHRPVFGRHTPKGATARCADGSYSFSEHRQGTCSHHGGVATWF